MRVIYLSAIWTIILDFAAWFIIHMSAAFFTYKLPAKIFRPGKFPWSDFKWERSGEIYNRIFSVKKWKDYLPDGAAIFKKGFRKKSMNTSKPEYIEKFIMESCRAELTHLLAIFPVIFFFLWNGFYAGIIMIIYALAANVPCLIAQRYNRPRLKRLLSRMHKIAPQEKAFSQKG